MNDGKIKILVIDDHRPTREVIIQTLTAEESEDFELFAAPGGREGLQIAKLKQPDIILLDMNMPGLDGIATCRALKRAPMTKHIPVIFLTASGDPKDVKGAIESGGSDYIVKPFEPLELVSRIVKVLAKIRFDPNAVVKKDDPPVPE